MKIGLVFLVSVFLGSYFLGSFLGNNKQIEVFVNKSNCDLLNESCHIVNRDIEQTPKQSVSVDYLKRCIDVQAERGKQYDASGTGERSFDAAAKAFNALTGEKLNGSDV